MDVPSPVGCEMKKFIWTDEMMTILIEGRDASPPLSYKAISKRLFVPEHLCRGKNIRLVNGSDAMPVKRTERQRDCLGCQTEFTSTHIGNFVCPDCKTHSSWSGSTLEFSLVRT
jgi:hypothetical protein